MANMASFRNGFKIISSAALQQKNLVNISDNTFNVRRGHLGRKRWCAITNLDEEGTGEKSRLCSNSCLKDTTSDWKLSVAGIELGEALEGVKGSKHDSQTHKNLFIDPNNSMWHLYSESKSSYGKGRHSVGEPALFLEISPPEKMSEATEEQSVTENIKEYYKARWESEHEACEMSEESVPDETLSTPVRRTEVRRSLKEASKGTVSVSDYKKTISKGLKPRSVAIVEDIDEPLDGKILGEHPLENLEGSYALSSPSTMTNAAFSKTRSKVGERSTISESLTPNKEVSSSTIPASSTPFKTSLLTFKYNPISHFSKNLYRYYSICSISFSKETQVSNTKLTPPTLLKPTYNGFNEMALRKFNSQSSGPLEFLNARFPFMKPGNISSYRFVREKSKDCCPPKQELPCVKPSPKITPSKMNVYKVLWPQNEKICMPCCKPVEMKCGEQVKMKSCKEPEYRSPSFSECAKEKTEKMMQKECCYTKLKCPEHEVDAASKSPFKTVKQRRDRILGRKLTEDSSCKKHFSTSSQINSKNECKKPNNLPCLKNIEYEKICNPGDNFVIKWPECEKICLPCCRPVVIQKCAENVKLKSCKKQEYHHPSFSECKKDKLVEKRLKECCHEEKRRCAQFDMDNVKRSPFVTVQQRTDKILGREIIEPCAKPN